MHFDLFECYCVEMCVSLSSAHLSHVPSIYTSWGVGGEGPAAGPCTGLSGACPQGQSRTKQYSHHQSVASSQTPEQSFSLFHGHSPLLHTLPPPQSLALSALPSFLPHWSTEHHPFPQACPGHSQSSLGYRKPGPEMGNFVSSTGGERRAGG